MKEVAFILWQVIGCPFDNGCYGVENWRWHEVFETQKNCQDHVKSKWGDAKFDGETFSMKWGEAIIYMRCKALGQDPHTESERLQMRMRKPRTVPAR